MTNPRNIIHSKRYDGNVLPRYDYYDNVPGASSVPAGKPVIWTCQDVTEVLLIEQTQDWQVQPADEGFAEFNLQDDRDGSFNNALWTESKSSGVSRSFRTGLNYTWLDYTGFNAGDSVFLEPDPQILFGYTLEPVFELQFSTAPNAGKLKLAVQDSRTAKTSTVYSGIEIRDDGSLYYIRRVYDGNSSAVKDNETSSSEPIDEKREIQLAHANEMTVQFDTDVGAHRFAWENLDSFDKNTTASALDPVSTNHGGYCLHIEAESNSNGNFDFSDTTVAIREDVYMEWSR